VVFEGTVEEARRDETRLAQHLGVF
jgi:hypothetical protein